MPEGHVIHRLADGLTELFGGRTVRVASPQGRFADEAALLDGGVLTGAEGYGKHLFIDFGPERVVHINNFAETEIVTKSLSKTDLATPEDAIAVLVQQQPDLLDPQAFNDLDDSQIFTL